LVSDPAAFALHLSSSGESVAGDKCIFGAVVATTRSFAQTDLASADY
jgi:hypothetical protein